MGARPLDVFLLLTAEGLFVTIMGVVLGVVFLTLMTLALGPVLKSHYGLAIQLQWLSPEELKLLAAVVCVGLFASLIPGYRAYRLSLADGLTPRI